MQSSPSIGNHSGSTLVEFSRAIGVSDPASAKLIAIKEAMAIYAKAKWSEKWHLIVESDSNNVVFWIRNPCCAPFPFKRLVQDCIEIGKYLSWEVAAVDRNQNTDADLLAKAGINRNLAHLKFFFEKK
ncbi:hypothetical protein V6N11_030833 [Hibiscus sabdariffa]|uniref:RNase H type-1 domain-containing protein n=1 Tax=Hibiscus sabdariffa TaxID=183260 RepID=A0ABR2AH79_9ROSI